MADTTNSVIDGQDFFTQITTPMSTITEYKGKVYDHRYGGAFDRGSADSYYGRRRRPHLFVEGTYTSAEVTEKDLTAEDIAAYNAGYDWNEELGDKKCWD